MASTAAAGVDTWGYALVAAAGSCPRGGDIFEC